MNPQPAFSIVSVKAIAKELDIPDAGNFRFVPIDFQKEPLLDERDDALHRSFGIMQPHPDGYA
ncbi:hypothetical protein [Proteiniphilum sp. UBA5480]|uniref:hypothetical protein n=1 Tax=Proteiniphilum sp. UBA5480 TaxID=1947282 RepID=UPI00257F24BC|nr:hypothetical protein [Proteiniphilum sp. UBA5480]